MRNIKIKLADPMIFIFLLAFLFSGAEVAAGKEIAECEGKFAEISQNSDGVSEKIADWKSSSEACEGTGFYEYQLAKLYIRDRDYLAANSVLSKSEDFPSPYNQYAALAKGDVFLHQKNYASAEAEYRQVVSAYPEWRNGYSNLGFSQLAQGKYQEAISNFEKSIGIEPSSTAYRDAALAYYKLNQHERAVSAVNKAFSLNEEIVRERDVMLVGVRSYSELGEFEVARNLLGMLLRARPDLKEDNEFLKAGLFLRQKMVEAGRIVE